MSPPLFQLLFSNFPTVLQSRIQSRVFFKGRNIQVYLSQGDSRTEWGIWARWGPRIDSARCPLDSPSSQLHPASGFLQNDSLEAEESQFQWRQSLKKQCFLITTIIYYVGLHSKFNTFCHFLMIFIVFCRSTSTKIQIPQLLVNRFAKIRMLGEATMTYYPTGTARSRCAGPSGPKSPIPCGDHPGLDKPK